MLRYSLFLMLLSLSVATHGQTPFYRLLDAGGQALLDGDIPTAKRSLEQALQVMPPNVSSEERAILYNNLGVVCYQTGAYKKGIDWYLQELEIYRKMRNDSLIAGSLYNLGLAYKEIGLHTKAMEELIRSAGVFERLGNSKELSSAWNSIGVMQQEVGDFEKALDYHRRALQLRQTIGYAKGIADSYHNIGDVYLSWKRYAKAEVYLLEALTQKKRLANQSNIINTLSALGKLYIAVGDTKTAYSYLIQAYKQAKKSDNSPKIAESMCYLATYYATIGEEAKAVELFRRTQEIARTSMDWQLLRDALQGEITLMEHRWPAAEIIRKYHELLEVKEKVVKDLNSKELARLEISYDVKRKNAELKLRRKQASIDRLQNQRLTAWLAAVVGVALFAGMAFYQMRRRKKQVESQRDQIVHLHHELSHRTKNYFGLLSGILRSDRKKAASREVIQVLDVNILRLDAMALVQGYLLQDRDQSDNRVQLDAYLDHLISELLANLFPNEDVLKVERDLDTLSLNYDKAMRVAIVLNELICNAIEHGLTGVEQPRLAITLKRHENMFSLIVRDNGPGLPEKLLLSPTAKGRDLIAKLLHPVDGTVAYCNDGGCVAEVVVPFP